MKRLGRGRGRVSGALIASALLHGGAIALLWAFASQGATVPHLKVIAVDIVSPPPREAGEPTPERVAAEAEPAPEPEPTPPAPEPTPPEPAPTPPAPRETPRQAAAPRETRPAPQRPQPQPEREPSTPSRPTSTPSASESTPTQPRETQTAAREPTPEPPRQGEPAERTTPSRGASPSPDSPGGENLAVRTEGATCPSQEYCNNIAAMVKRYFRRPADSYSDRGDVCFRIARDGGVDNLEVQRLRGSFAFRLALMEAVEQAGQRNEFGPLPRAFGSDWLPVCVGVTPQL